jgi:hypothetical protein
LLSVALVLRLRATDVIRYVALWCPDFPTQISPNQQAVFLVEGKDTEIVESPKLEVWIYNLEKN